MANVGAFAERAFALRGDPDAIGGSAGIWTRFATDTDSTAADLRGLYATDFEGDEADTYRGRINTDLPPYLDTASRAWAMVGGAVRTYAATLADLQTQMGSLRSTAWTQWQSAIAADAAASRADADDHAHTADRQRLSEALTPGEALPPDTYQPAGATARSAAASANTAYTGSVSAADQLRAQHTQAVNACADAIDRATATRFADPPSWLGHLWEKACDWVADHIDILQTLSAVLKQISSIARMLAMIPVLAPLAGPVAAGAGMLAFGIDAGIKVTTGQGNWTDIAIAGMSFIPGAKAAMASDLLSTTNDAAHGNLDWTQLATTAVLGAAGGRGRDTHGATTESVPRAGPQRTDGPTSADIELVPDHPGVTSAPPGRETRAALPVESHTFSSDEVLRDHFEKHGKQFEAGTPAEYARLAERFRDRGLAGEFPIKDGTEVFKVWDQDTHSFGVYDNDSHCTYTFFRARSATYFDRQEGVLRWSGED